MWFFLLIIGMVASYVSARRWGYRLYQYYRPRIAYSVRAFRTRKLPASETEDDVAKKKFDLESVIMFLFVSNAAWAWINLEHRAAFSISANWCGFSVFSKQSSLLRSSVSGRFSLDSSNSVYCVCVIDIFIRTVHWCSLYSLIHLYSFLFQHSFHWYCTQPVSWIKTNKKNSKNIFT